MAAFLSSFRALDIQHHDLLADHPAREVRALVLQLNSPPVPAFQFRDPFYNTDWLTIIQMPSTHDLQTFNNLSAAHLRKLKIIAESYKWESGFLFHKKESEDWTWVPIINQRQTFVARAHLLGHFGLISTVSRLHQAFRVFGLV